MVVDHGAVVRPGGHDLQALREDRLLWWLIGAVLVCLALALALMALWNPIFGAILLAVYLPIAGGVIVAGRGREERRRALLRCLAIAVGQGMPLPEALEALAEQQRGGSRGRLLALAGLLRAGAPLSDALVLVPGTLSRQAAAQIGVAVNSGRLAEALREAADAGADSLPLRADAATRIGYMIHVCVYAQLIVFFIFYFVMPKFEAIFKNFDMPLPQATVAAILVGRWVIAFGWPIFVPLLLADLTLPIVVPLAIGGWIEGNLPLIDRLFPSRHSAPILRALASVAEGGLPLPAGISTLLRSYPSGWVHGRLEWVLHDLSEGVDGWQSLRDRGLIRRADAAVLESAMRVGNLPWALRETAAGAERRSIGRLRAWLFALSAAGLLGLGATVLLVASAIIQPLVTLLQRLSG